MRSMSFRDMQTSKSEKIIIAPPPAKSWLRPCMLDSNMLWTSHPNLVYIKLYRYDKKTKVHLSEQFFFLYTIHYLSHTYNIVYYYGDLNIAMLTNCKKEPLD